MENFLYQDLYNLEDKHWWHIAKRNLVTFFIEKYNNQQGQLKILDVGCGTGKNMEVLKIMGTTFGIDSSTQAIKFCKKRGLKNLSVETIDHTRFDKESFDLITALDVIEHTDDNKALQEIHRILNKNGILIITVPALPWLWSKWDDVLHHKRRYVKRSLINIIEKHGFRILKISYMNSFLIVPVLIVRFIKNIIFPNNYPSDFLLTPPIINQILFLLTKIESIFIKQGLVLIGLSLIVVAKKNLKKYT